MIDGAVAWTGGAGIEDHFRDGRFHDVMTRLTGDVVRQAQAAFLTSFHAHGGELPADLSPCFPAPEERGRSPSRSRRSCRAGSLRRPRRSASRSTARASGWT